MKWGGWTIKSSEIILSQKKWIKELSLNYPWKNAYSPIICLTLALSTLSKQVADGYFIGKQTFTIHAYPIVQSDIALKSEIIKKKQIKHIDYLICHSEAKAKNALLAEMSSTLIKKTQSSYKGAEATQYKIGSFITITKEQVHKFSELSGDPNNIHRGLRPIVQAMLLLLFIEDYLSVENRFIKKAEITYLKPIEADCKLFFSWESPNILCGIVNHTKCFALTIKEEFTC